MVSQSQSQDRREFGEIVVFTGDLVGSSKLSSDDLAKSIRALELASYEIVRAFGLVGSRFTEFQGDQARGPSDHGLEWKPRFSAFRGDGWQCVGPQPAFSLRGALIMRAHLASLGKPFDTRISIGIGAGWVIADEDLRVAAGPAFELSGRGLDTIGQTRRFSVAWEDPPEEARLVQAIFALADEISRKWTPGQAKVFARLLVETPRLSQDRLAAALGVTQQSIAEHLSGGGDWALQEALKALEEDR